MCDLDFVDPILTLAWGLLESMKGINGNRFFSHL